jgi:hypothetical protein
MPLQVYNDFGMNTSKKSPKRTGVKPPSWLDPDKVRYDVGGKDPKAHIQPITLPKPKPRPLSALDKYLAGDSVYQQALRGNKRTLADFLSDLTRRRGESGTQFYKTRASMDRDSKDQLNALAEEYASRGLIQSGLYAKAQGDFRTKFGEQMNALKDQQTNLIADLASQERNYRRENSLANESARQAALLRRAQRYGVGGK